MDIPEQLIGFHAVLADQFSNAHISNDKRRLPKALEPPQ